MRASILVILVLSACGPQAREEAAAIQVLNATEFNDRLNGDVVLLDVRTPQEFAGGYIPGAINIDYKSAGFAERLDSLDKAKHYMLYCASGARSDKTSALMHEKGFTSVTVLDGGISAWEAGGLPVER